MTMPLPLSQSLPGVIIDGTESPVISRIGVVTDVVEADNITVRISGSPSLVTASYLFPLYEPVLGDIVYVTKQNSQWFVVGTMSGPLNTEIPNASFELGTISATPTDWSFVTVSTVAGTPTFRKEIALPVAGQYVAIARNSSAGVAGTSSGNAVSEVVPAGESERWSLAYFQTFAEPDVNASLVPQGGYIQVTGSIQFFDSDLNLLTDEFCTFMPMTSSFQDAIYVRTFTATGQPYVTSPIGTAFARVKFFIVFTMHVNSASEVGFDVVYLRRQLAGT